MDQNEHDHAKHMDHMMHAMNSTLSPMGSRPGGESRAETDAHSGDMSRHGHGTGHMASHMMKMYFHCSTDATILFSGWQTTNWQTMLGSCVAVFFMAALYEGLKVGRRLLQRSSVRSTNYNAVPVSSSNGFADDRKPVSGTTVLRMLSLAHALQTLLHLVQVVLSYLLMLIFMTYNVWLCIAVGLGAAVGYFLFSWKLPVVVDMNEHCH